MGFVDGLMVIAGLGISLRARRWLFAFCYASLAFLLIYGQRLEVLFRRAVTITVTILLHGEIEKESLVDMDVDYED